MVASPPHSHFSPTWSLLSRIVAAPPHYRQRRQNIFNPLNVRLKLPLFYLGVMLPKKNKNDRMNGTFQIWPHYHLYLDIFGYPDTFF